MPEQLLAVADFVRHSIRSLGVVPTPEAKEIIRHLLHYRKMTMADLIERISLSQSPDELLIHLAKCSRNTPFWDEFLESICCVPKDWWREVFSPREYITEILEERDLLRLVNSRSFRKLLCKDHPLVELINFDPYWSQRVRWFLVKGDFRRAWDELNKARKGFPDEQFLGFSPAQQKQLIETGQFYACHHGGASLLTLAQLVEELFQAMVNAGLVRAITTADLREINAVRRRIVYETPAPAQRRTRKPRAYEVRTKPPGSCFARLFLTEAQSANPGDITFPRRAAMVLQIAQYFSELRNRARRTRHELALVAYYATQQAGPLG